MMAEKEICEVDTDPGIVDEEVYVTEENSEKNDETFGENDGVDDEKCDGDENVKNEKIDGDENDHDIDKGEGDENDDGEEKYDVDEKDDGDEKGDVDENDDIDNNDYNDDIAIATCESDKFIQKMMQSTVLLSDGTAAKIFSRGPKYSEILWPINCHVCLVGNIHQKRGLLKHIKSKRHKKLMKRPPPHPRSYMRAFRQPIGTDPGIVTPLQIFPGEIITDITPELQHRVMRRNDWKHKELKEDKISSDCVEEHNKKTRMMGLCYAFKMKRFNRTLYYCVLCRTYIHGKRDQHFVSSRHVNKYIELHFANLRKKVEKFIEELRPSVATFMESKRKEYIREIFDRIYTKIEIQKGAREAKFVNAHDFKMNRSRYAKKFREREHYNENTISISDKELEEFVKRALSIKPLENSSLQMINTEESGVTETTPSQEQQAKVEELSSEDKAKNSTMPSEDKAVEKRSRTVSETRTAKRLRKSKLFADSPLVWDRYSRMIGAMLDDMEDEYERYERDPESHPEYELEWKKFWHRRADELEKDNIDPHTFDFNAEWMPFWIQRLQKFHAKDIVKRKFDTKRKLNLSYDARSPSPVRRKKRPQKSRSPSPRRTNERRRSRKQRENSMPPRKRQKYLRDEPLTIVSVMRLVSALEDQLGSLGPRAVELLSRAILFEKNNPNPNDLLLENDFYVFFITAREKLKGQILAGIVELDKINAVNQTIDRITPMVNMMEEYRARNSDDGRNIQYGNRYNANNKFINNIGPPNNQYPNQYSGGNQGGIWQSGAYCAEKIANIGANNQSMPSTSNYSGANKNDNYQSVGGRQAGKFQMGGSGDYCYRVGQINALSAAGNRQFSGSTEFSRMDGGDNGNVQMRRAHDSNMNSEMVAFKRGGPNISGTSNRGVRMSGPNRANQMGGNSGEVYNRGGNFSGCGNQMANSRDDGPIGGGFRSNQTNTGYNQPNNMGGMTSGMGFDIATTLLMSLGGNNPNGRADGMAMVQNAMQNYSGAAGYNSRSNKMNFQYNRNNNNNNGRFEN